MRYVGSKPLEWSGFESKKLIEWLAPVAITAGLTYASSFVAALREQGGWRAVLAVVLTLAGRSVYAWLMDNSREHT